MMYRSCSDCGCSLDPQESCHCGGTDASYTRGNFQRSPGRTHSRKNPQPAPTIPISPEERQAGQDIFNALMKKLKVQEAERSLRR